MGNFFVTLHAKLTNKPWLFYALLLAITSISFAGILRLRITENIFAVLPKGEEFQQFNTLIESKNISNQMVFSIAVDSSKDNDYHLALADSVALVLDSCGKGFITAITAIRPDVQQEYYQPATL